MLDTLLKVHGHEIFINGAFNGDPQYVFNYYYVLLFRVINPTIAYFFTFNRFINSPGNILLLDDGRLGLIDYGQVKYLTKEERIKCARLIVSLANNDEVFNY